MRDVNIRHRGRRGFSLAELLVGLAVLGLLIGLGGPQFARLIAEQRLLNEARRLAEGLGRARVEAVKRNVRVDLCAASAGRCSEDAVWHHGWLMFTDPDATGEPDDPAALIAVERALPVKVSVTGNHPIAHYVSFTFDGHARRLDGALQMGTFTVCEKGLIAVSVVLANSGRVRVERGKAVCP